MGTLGGVLDAPHLRRTCAAVVASPSRPQDAFRCNFFELRYPSPLGGIFATPRLRRGCPESVATSKTLQNDPSPLGGVFAAPRLRRGGPESVATPKMTQDAPRCDSYELWGPPPRWASKKSLLGVQAPPRPSQDGSQVGGQNTQFWTPKLASIWGGLDS